MTEAADGESSKDVMVRVTASEADAFYLAINRVLFDWRFPASLLGLSLLAAALTVLALDAPWLWLGVAAIFFVASFANEYFFQRVKLALATLTKSFSSSSPRVEYSEDIESLPLWRRPLDAQSSPAEVDAVLLPPRSMRREMWKAERALQLTKVAPFALIAGGLILSLVWPGLFAITNSDWQASDALIHVPFIAGLPLLSTWWFVVRGARERGSHLEVVLRAVRGRLAELWASDPNFLEGRVLKNSGTAYVIDSKRILAKSTKPVRFMLTLGIPTVVIAALIAVLFAIGRQLPLA